MIIEYKGKKLKTDRHLPMSDADFLKLKEEYYQKPTIDEVKAEIMKIMSGGNVTMPNIKSYFFKDLMSKVRVYSAKWTIEEAFEHKPILEVFNYSITQNEGIFNPELPKIRNILQAIQIGGAGVAKQPTNFDLGNTIDLIKKYNINGNYYDPSCGWGVRMIGSLCCGVNYYGTDPNYELTKQLNAVGALFTEVDLFAPSYDVFTQGSEIYIPQLENTIGLIFTSPPYFFLEDYGIGQQSTTLYPEYDDWLKHYYLPTFQNCYKYAIDGAYMLINIKNYGKYDLEEQTVILAKKAGFKFIGKENYDNIKRINVNGELNESDENIYVFRKDNYAKII